MTQGREGAAAGSEVRGGAVGADENSEALVEVPPELNAEPLKLSPALARLPVELEVAVPMREFRVRDLVLLEAGQVIETQWGHAEDMPLRAGDVQLAWSEFEVVETKLAVRVTRLA